MAFEYKGWFMGFTLDTVNTKGAYWCQLNKQEVAMLLVIYERLKGAGEAVAQSHMASHLMARKKIAGADANKISEWLIKLSEGKVSV